MDNKEYPKTHDAVNYILSFGEIKKIVTVYGIIDMHVEDKSNESLVYLKPNGDIKERISLSDVINMGDSSTQKEWMSFVLRNTFIHLQQMVDELTKGIAFKSKSEGALLIKSLENDFSEIKEKLDRPSIETKILDYQHNLKKNKIIDNEVLGLRDNLPKYMKLIENILNQFDYKFKMINRQYDIRLKELASETRNEFFDEAIIVDHRLRWDTTIDNFEDFFGHLVDKKKIAFANGKGSTEEIMKILKMVFEEVKVPVGKRVREDSNFILPMIKESFTIPNKLKWNCGGTAFAKEFAPRVEYPKTIFVIKYGKTEKGEIPEIARILEQVIEFPRDKGKVNLKKSGIVRLLSGESL